MKEEYEELKARIVILERAVLAHPGSIDLYNKGQFVRRMSEVIEGTNSKFYFFLVKVNMPTDMNKMIGDKCTPILIEDVFTGLKRYLSSYSVSVGLYDNTTCIISSKINIYTELNSAIDSYVRTEFDEFKTMKIVIVGTETAKDDNMFAIIQRLDYGLNKSSVTANASFFITEKL